MFYVESFGHDERSTQFSEDGCCDTLTSSDYKQPIIVAYEADMPNVSDNCYAIYSHPMASVMKIDSSGAVPTITSKIAKGSADGPLVLIEHGVGCFQNTGQGWWTEGNIAETLRTPCGGDSVKANLVAIRRERT